MNKILEIKNLTKYYDSVLGIKNLSLNLNEGEIFGFIGPNGAGKSTTIRLIMNLINKTSGTILLNDKELNKNDPKTTTFPSNIIWYKLPVSPFGNLK